MKKFLNHILDLLFKNMDLNLKINILITQHLTKQKTKQAIYSIER